MNPIKSVVSDYQSDPRRRWLAWWWNVSVKYVLPGVGALVMFLGGLLISLRAQVDANTIKLIQQRESIDALKELIKERQATLDKISEKLTEIQISIGKLQTKLETK